MEIKNEGHVYFKKEGKIFKKFGDGEKIVTNPIRIKELELLFKPKKVVKKSKKES